MTECDSVVTLKEATGQIAFVGIGSSNRHLINKYQNQQYRTFALYGSHSRSEMRQTQRDLRDKINPAGIVTIGQEGGFVHRFGWMPKVRALWAGLLTATGDPKYAEEAGYLTGQIMRLYSINLNFAPFMDLHSDIPVRRYSDDAKTIALYGSAYMKGLLRASVGACAKHFPDSAAAVPVPRSTVTAIFGRDKSWQQFFLDPKSPNLIFKHWVWNKFQTRIINPTKRRKLRNIFIKVNRDPHTKAISANYTLDEMKVKERYQPLIDAGLPAVMTSHVIFPKIDPTKPASLSKIWHDYLRNKLGFNGLIITDGLEMKAVAYATKSRAEAVIAAFNAGTDLILSDRPNTVRQALTTGLLTGQISYQRLQESLARIKAFQCKYPIDRTKRTWTQRKKTERAILRKVAKLYRQVKRAIVAKAKAKALKPKKIVK